MEKSFTVVFLELLYRDACGQPIINTIPPPQELSVGEEGTPEPLSRSDSLGSTSQSAWIVFSPQVEKTFCQLLRHTRLSSSKCTYRRGAASDVRKPLLEIHPHLVSSKREAPASSCFEEYLCVFLQAS